MFTGIIEETGKIKSVSKGMRSVILEIEANKVLEGTIPGDSIAVNGVPDRDWNRGRIFCG